MYIVIIANNINYKYICVCMNFIRDFFTDTRVIDFNHPLISDQPARLTVITPSGKNSARVVQVAQVVHVMALSLTAVLLGLRFVDNSATNKIVSICLKPSIDFSANWSIIHFVAIVFFIFQASSSQMRAQFTPHSAMHAWIPRPVMQLSATSRPRPCGR